MKIIDLHTTWKRVKLDLIVKPSLIVQRKTLIDSFNGKDYFLGMVYNDKIDFSSSLQSSDLYSYKPLRCRRLKNQITKQGSRTIFTFDKYG